MRDRARLVALARRIVVDPAEADDVVQDAALIALTRAPRDGRAASGWLRRVVRNLGLNRLRAAGRRRDHEQAAPPRAPTPGPDELAADWEARRRIVEAVLALPEPYRETVLLLWFEGLSRAETAERQGVSVEAVKSRRRRAFAMLRERLDDPHDRRAVLLLAGPAFDGTPVVPAPVTSSSTTATVAGGVLAMSLAKKTVVAAALLLGLGAYWSTTRPEPAPETPTEVASAEPDGRGPARTTAPRTGSSTADADAEATPPTTDAADLGEFDPSRDVRGVVVDVDGQPIAGARVAGFSRFGRFWGVLDMDMARERVPGPETTTDEDGRFRLRLGRGAVGLMEATADGHAQASLDSVFAGADVELELGPAVELTVEVVGPDGAPVSAAEVSLAFLTPGRQPDVLHLDRRTDDAGTVVVPDAPVGRRLSAHVAADGLDRGSGGLDALEEDTTLRIELTRSDDASGIVVDAVDGSPIPDAVIGRFWVQESPVRTNERGRFVLPSGSSAGELHATHPDYGRARVKVDGTNELRIAMERGDAVTGRVVDRDGAVVEGAIVHAIASRMNGSEQTVSLGTTRTTAAGTFVIGGLSRDRSHALIVLADGHGRLATEFAPRSDGPGTIELGDLRLPRAALLRGDVVGPDGAPLASSKVTVSLPTPECSGGYSDELELWTDAAGAFAVSGLGPGVHEVAIANEDHGILRESREIVDGADPEPVLLRYEPAEDRLATREFRVRVVDESGQPVPDVQVQCECEGFTGATARTDQNGIAVAQVDGPVALVRVFLDPSTGFLGPEPVHAKRGASRAEVVLRRGGRIRGTVVDEEGEPVAGAAVSARWRAGNRSHWASGGFSSDDGGFELIVPPGTVVRLLAEVSGGDLDEASTPSGSLDGVRAGDSAVRLVVGLPVMDGSITVRLLAPDGTPLAGEGVMTNPPGGRRWITETTDTAGRAHFTGLPRIELGFLGRWLPGTDPEGAASYRYPAPRVVRAVPEGQEIVLQCPEAATITGAFVDADDTPRAGALVSAFLDSGLGVANARTDADGRFCLLVPADELGSYTIRVQWSPAPGERAVHCGMTSGVHAGDTDVRITRIIR